MRFVAAVLLALPLLLAQSSYLQIRTIAGSNFIGDNGPASAALFLNLAGIAIDPLGNLYLSDTDAHRIRKITPSGLTTTFAGTGVAGFSGDGGPASQAALNFPYGIATDYAGSVYVADLGNSRIRKITPDGIITTIAGHTPETKLVSPRNVAVDGPGNVYISDFGGHRVYRLSYTTGLIPVAGTGRPGNTGDNGPATAALLYSPAGLTIDPSGNLYIGDTGNKTVRKVAAGTGIITTIPESLLRALVATGISYSLLGELWVADGAGGTLTRLPSGQPGVALPFAAMDIVSDFAGNSYTVQENLIRKISSRGGAVTILGGGNPYYFAGDGGDSTRARLWEPAGLAFDAAAGYLYIADSRNKRVRRVSANTGIIETIVDSVALSNPQGLCWDAKQGQLYIADAGNHTVWLWKPGNTLARSFAGNGKTGFAGDNGAALDAQLQAPTAVAVDDRGNVWISDTGNDRVRLVSPEGKIRTVTSRILSPAGIVWDAAGGFAYVASPASSSIFRVTAAGVPEAIASSSAGIWREPRGLALEPSGSLLVADPAAQRVTRWNPDGRIAPVAGSGESGFDGDSPVAAVAARLNNPTALALDARGRIFVADTANHRVRLIEETTGEPVVGALVTEPSTAVSLLNAASRLPVPAIAAGGLFLLGGTTANPDDQVAFNGIAVPWTEIRNGERIVQIPSELTGETAAAELTLTRAGIVIVRQNVKVAAAAPGVFLPIVNTATATPNSPLDPVTRGQSLTLRITGEGRQSLPLRIRIRETDAAVLSAAPSESEPGVLLVEVQAPGGFFPAGTFPLTVQFGEFPAQPGLTVSIR